MAHCVHCESCLKRPKGLPKIHADKLDLTAMEWKDYETAINLHVSLSPRKKELSAAQALFQQHPSSFSDIDLLDRKKLLGTVSETSLLQPPPCFTNNPQTCLNWHFLGRLTRLAAYCEYHALNIAQAIDLIPLNGDIPHKLYQQYFDTFTGGNESSNPIATATRLLAMKRPDQFVCVNNANRETLCKQFGINDKGFDAGSYWLLIEKIRKTPWFNAPDDGSDLFKYRVALLDCLVYESEWL